MIHTSTVQTSETARPRDWSRLAVALAATVLLGLAVTGPTLSAAGGAGSTGQVEAQGKRF